MNSQLRVAIVDDNNQTLQLISNAVKVIFANLSTNIELCAFSKPDSFLYELSDKEFDLLLLDIEMPGIDGMQVAKSIREKHLDMDIIFISNREDRVFETFEVSPFGFIRKSRFLEDVNEVVGLYVKKKLNTASEQTFVFSCGKETVSLPIKNVIYVENMDHCQYLYATGIEEPYSLRSTMKAISEELSQYGFIEPCKGYLVNYRYISSIKGNSLTLRTGNKELPLARRKTSQFMEEYMSWKKKDMSVIL